MATGREDPRARRPDHGQARHHPHRKAAARLLFLVAERGRPRPRRLVRARSGKDQPGLLFPAAAAVAASEGTGLGLAAEGNVAPSDSLVPPCPPPIPPPQPGEEMLQVASTSSACLATTSASSPSPSTRSYENCEHAW